MHSFRSYVSVGFVDLQQVMEGEILSSLSNSPVTWYGYDMSTIAVARAKIIVDLIQTDTATVDDILQIWYSSCLSKNACETLKQVCLGYHSPCRNARKTF